MGWQEGRGKGRAEEGQARSVFSVGGMRGYPWEYESGVLRQTMGPGTETDDGTIYTCTTWTKNVFASVACLALGS